MVQVINYVRSYGTPNVYGARVPMATHWNLQLWSQLATSTADREVVQFLRYGWSLNHDGSPVTVTWGNHAFAERYPQLMQEYLDKEFAMGCLLGPFETIPWQRAVVVSPMSTRPKKDSTKRRIIMDLSWPHDGHSVNDGIS